MFYTSGVDLSLLVGNVLEGQAAMMDSWVGYLMLFSLLRWPQGGGVHSGKALTHKGAVIHFSTWCVVSV